MKTITIRDLRQRWPEAEAALQVEKEILITRDSQPVAKLVRVLPPRTKRRTWNPEAHAARIEKYSAILFFRALILIWAKAGLIAFCDLY